ncbi:prepilin-type N-terminal cleavage/methylation domain-containing protein [Caenimonas sedimenti]|uniref:Prepilin-type N-terminal cleavage/methylation domain-containing protein n=1 Tax=Caenimonas sedimenti TaxID=2596921 RepID=A0A562ZHD0_9BURK|nr:prepilin-type N-terminal cleavage/methylation domain-containing protein [Caenimonas sedimenti]TWO67923.1 prepilin-type N-terminal cleavage/methylation domain-containing protein [Caenimonas sedimenti]
MRANRRVLRGFTLVEILVAVSLLSVVMLGLGSALRTMGQAEEKIDARLARADEMRMASTFMRSTLARVSLRRVTPPPPGRPSVLFAAAPQAVSWVGVMPARFGAGGRYFFRLAQEPLEEGAGLVLRFQRWTDAAVFPDWSQAEARVLVRDVRAVQMRFLDVEAAAPAWLDGWTAIDRVPDRVLIQLETAHGPWPPLFMPMRPLPASDPSSGGAVFGAG